MSLLDTRGDSAHLRGAPGEPNPMRGLQPPWQLRVGVINDPAELQLASLRFPTCTTLEGRPSAAGHVLHPSNPHLQGLPARRPEKPCGWATGCA